MSFVMAPDTLDLASETHPCNNATMPLETCNALIANLHAPDGPDVLVVHCQEVHHAEQIKQLEAALLASPQLGLVSSALMVTRTKFEREVLAGHTGLATFVLYRKAKISTLSFVKEDRLEIRTSVFPGKGWNQGGHSNTLLIPCEPTVYRVNTITGQLDHAIHLTSIKQRATKFAKTWEDLLTLVPDLQCVGFVLKDNPGPIENQFTELKPRSPFERVRDHLVYALHEQVPDLAKTVATLDETDTNKALLLSLHQHHVSPHQSGSKPMIETHSIKQFLSEVLKRQTQWIKKCFEPRQFTSYKKKYVEPKSQFEQAYFAYDNNPSIETQQKLLAALDALDSATKDPQKKEALQAFRTTLNGLSEQSSLTSEQTSQRESVFGIAAAEQLMNLYKAPLKALREKEQDRGESIKNS